MIDLVGNGTDTLAEAEYRMWVRDNRPELMADLFDSVNQGLNYTPDTIDVHRELVAEWQAQR